MKGELRTDYSLQFGVKVDDLGVMRDNVTLRVALFVCVVSV